MLTPVLSCLLAASIAGAQLPQRGVPPPQAPHLKRERSSRVLFVRILEAEDKRTDTKALLKLVEPKGDLGTSHLGVRRRAAVALGRIGDRGTVLQLAQMLGTVDIPELRADIAFALGEIDDDAGAVTKLLEVLNKKEETTAVRARVVEALGKIASSPRPARQLGEARVRQVAGAVAAAIPAAGAPKGDDLLLAYLATTALLRLREPSTLPALKPLLASQVSELRASAANAVARLRPEPAAAADLVPSLLSMTKDTDPVARANAARALVAAKAPGAADAIVPLLSDADQRVVASAARALGALADAKAATPLGALGQRLLAGYRAHVSAKRPGVPDQHGLLMVVAEALGAIKDPASLPFLQSLRALDGATGANPETELAVAAYGEAAFFDVPAKLAVPAEWRHVANYAQGLGAAGGARARQELLDIAAGRSFPGLDARAIPDVLTALAKVKPEGLEQILISNLSSSDVVVRSTAAGLLGEHYAPSQSELTFKALDTALKATAGDRDNDAKLAILDAVAKYKERQRALDLLSGALGDRDYVVSRRAALLLEEAGQGSFVDKVVAATTPPRPRNYYTALEAAMRRPNPVAVLTTEKGEVRVELLVREAPMTVQNFVDLAKRGYFDGILFHRVVPNFVVQGGDPRGDGNGGPGYQIRCEINQVPYDRGAVGMALSGKDTGGSQFFFTHSPQPHLEGGYTVFGRVIGGMEVVDRLQRGDKILSVRIDESK